MDKTLLDLTEPEFDNVPEAYESQYWQHGEICVVRSTVMCAFHQDVLHGGTVVKVLCYKSEGHWFDPSWYNWNF